LFFAACGDDVTTQVIQDNNMSIVFTSKELPKCTKDNEGEQAFVKGETAPRVCMDGKWFATSSGDKDTVLVKDTVVMKDTIVVKDTVVLKENSGCTTKELKDKSGVKIICGGDSVGVVLNGKNGEKGDKGDAGAAGKDGTWDSAQVKAEIADSVLSKDAQKLLPKYRANVKGWGLSTTEPAFEKYIRRFASIENGLGVSGKCSLPLGCVCERCGAHQRANARFPLGSLHQGFGRIAFKQAKKQSTKELNSLCFITNS
jgi:hypothetical protein